MKKAIFIAILLGFFISVAWVKADTPGRWQRGRNEMALLEHLNLTPDQSAKIKDLRESYLIDQMKLRSELIDNHMELRLLWMQLNADPVKIKEKQKEIYGLVRLRMEKRTDFQLELRRILTPEQLSRYIAEKYGSAREQYRSKRKSKVKRKHYR